MAQITGVLLINLGTPESPEPAGVRRYLTEFLTDRRVIDANWLKRQWLVRGLIIPSRYQTSAKQYRAIWTSEGSPLLIYSRRMQNALQEKLGSSYVVELGMRYQKPSLQDALQRLIEKDLDHLVILPLFPQYASATSGSIQQRIFELLATYETVPKMTMIANFFNHQKVIDAFCAVARKQNLKPYDHFLFSFHGLPEAQLQKYDRYGHCLKTSNCCQKLTKYNRGCYAAQCHATAQAIANQLQIPSENYSLCFQSRLGKSPWLQPYASETIVACVKKGYKKLLIFSPSFVCDCLETLYEIGVEYSHEFKAAGGERLDLVEGLNDHPAWIDALASLVKGSD